MALNIKNASVENLALELSQLTGESKTEAPGAGRAQAAPCIPGGAREPR